ncbi:cupin domain-containing protein [Inquilinus limosus]|uniref:cupin domain-containing protein n=1 Tax=Inquilinus limosus TaxID=171674 RepID=UPI003F146B45
MSKKQEGELGNVRRSARGEQGTIEVLGILLEAKISEAETGGHYSLFEAVVPPGAGVPLHQHAQQEAFYVLEGQAQFCRIGASGGEWIDVGPGDTVTIPGGVMHGFRNPGSAPVRVLITCAQGLEAFFREAGVPVTAASPVPSGPPSPAAIERVIGIAIMHGQTFAPPEAMPSAA